MPHKISRSLFRFAVILLTANSFSFSTVYGRVLRADSLRGDTTLRVLVVDADIVEIEPFALEGCRALERVEFAAKGSLQKIGEYAFRDCGALRDMNIPESVIEIGDGAFSECANLRRISFPESLTVIPKSACAWDASLEEVVTGNKLQNLAAHAFAYCSSLKHIRFPSSLRRLGNNAFSECTSLTEAILPDSITEVGSYAFSGCRQLRVAELPANNSLLGELIFSGCTELQKLIMLSAVPPPFDCNSFIFEPDDDEAYSRCLLLVPASEIKRYAEAPGWKLFRRIETGGDKTCRQGR